MPDAFNPVSQHEVQRQLGRCLLRIQQYERLLKSMLSLHRFGEPADELQAIREKNIKQFGGKTLGQLAEVLFDTFAVREGTEHPVLDESRIAGDQMLMSFQFQMQMKEEGLDRMRSAVEELVRLRNELVHHLIERFNVWTDAGCDAALQHLKTTYAVIDSRYVELCEWAENLDKAREAAAAFAQGPVFTDWIVNGIAPDGSIDWQGAGIVRALREALKLMANDGWLQLDAAKRWMAAHHPDQTPERYGCKSWPHALQESKAFQLEYRQHEEERVAWFRELT
ncbi:OST-HTH/LOTUS domain-containing protein [Hydrogenophaga crocea]|uniref:HTH OST-type domain-containing protein n=1 Tax=Hydrogenophaga crocea TaxID=2716225 RepID=A0A6G8II72_9BURK|nr:OST-HTH/LOTUS domain-containing protein [Hydrogenophaga crocea]QIM52735.1 hypothetical protein G9Q37_11550 [Hydrogenophaga crocea]